MVLPWRHQASRRLASRGARARAPVSRWLTNMPLPALTEPGAPDTSLVRDFKPAPRPTLATPSPFKNGASLSAQLVEKEETVPGLVKVLRVIWRWVFRELEKLQSQPKQHSQRKVRDWLKAATAACRVVFQALVSPSYPL